MPSERSNSWVVIVVATVFALLVGGKAVTTVGAFAEAIVASGANTVGEAGKVYFAHRVARGEMPFASGLVAPHYPSAHGGLFHAVVGLAARPLALDRTDLYRLGRAITVALTLVSLFLCAGMLRRLGGGGGWALGAGVAWLSAMRVVEHSVSYRPDHWNLALSTLACFLLMAWPSRKVTLALLAVIPTVAFFFKPPGIVLLVPIVATLVLDSRRRAALAVASAGTALFAVSVALIDHAAEGLLLEGLRSARAPISWSAWKMAVGVNVRAYPLWLVLAMPLILMRSATWCEADRARHRRVVLTFFVTALGVAFLGAARLGSNVYYFVESFTFGLLLVTAWLAAPCGRLGARGLVVLAFALLGLPEWAANLRQGSFPLTPAVAETARFASDRAEIADDVNGRGLRCWSDDPALNVLLDAPEVIDPMIVSHAVEQGVLDETVLTDPIERQAYDLVVLTSRQWSYGSVPILRPAFRDALSRHYRVAPAGGAYLVLHPHESR